MDNFVIPPSPNWYNPHILACAPDNTLIYGSKNEVVIIHPTTGGESPKIDILPDDGSNHKVVCVDVNPKWDSPNKWILTSWDDKLVKVWDMKLLNWKKCSPAYKGEKDKLVAALFLSEDRILSVTDAGNLVICNIPTLKFTQITHIFLSKLTVTCMAPCPHSSNLVALGARTGLIIIIDLKRNGYITHRFRGHYEDITSLSWCPAPVNIFPDKPASLSRNKKNNKDEEDENNDLLNKKKEDLLKEVERRLAESISENSSSKQPQDLENKSCEAGEPILDGSQKEFSVSCETLEKPKTKDANEKVEPSMEENSSCEKVEYVMGEPSSCKLIKPFIETVEPVVEESENDVPTSCETVEPEGPEELLTSCEPVIEEPKKELSASCKPVEPLKEELPAFCGAVDELPSSCENFEALNEKLKGAPCACCSKKVVKNTYIKTVEMNGDVPQKDLMLASCSKDRSIIIWRARDDGKTLCIFKINERRGNSGKYKKNPSPSWHTMKWLNPFYFIVTTNKGEVLKYNLPKQLDAPQEYTLVHNEHVGFIFTIAAHVPTLTVDNWFADYEVKFWTFSLDMYLLNTTLDSKATHSLSIETFCAHVNCMTWCPMDPNRIALGLSNGTIKIWNTNSSSPKFFTTANYSPKIFGKITNLEWHPKNELLIAFSTEEGTIGILNTNNKIKATWFTQYFSSNIHNIQWAPYKDKICLYVLGKGSLVIFDADKPKEDPDKVLMQSKSIPYYFSWKLDMSLMMVSHICGEITFLDSNLDIKASYYNTKKMSLLKWHPDSENSSSDKSFWVAAALDNVVCLFDFAEVAEKNDTLNIDEAMKKKFEVHYSTVKEIAWNPFNGDQLVTAGEDGMAYVLNALDGTILASYYDKNKRFKPIRTIMWSPVEEDLLLMTVSKSASLIGWKSKDNVGAPSSEILKECQDLKNLKKNSSSTKEADVSKKILKAAKYVILPSITAIPIEKEEDKAKILNEILDDTVFNRSIENPSNIQKLFGKKDDVLLLLNSTEKTHLDKGRLESAATVSVFKGDLHNHITEAIQQQRVTPLLISLAPSVSTSIWQKACETYAGQLKSRSDADPLEVVLYFLSSQKIEEAIEYLCDKEMFKEALALVKSRLPSDSVIIEDIIKRWANYSTQCGTLEIAAICHIKQGKYEDAVKLLMRRNDVDILGFAYDLAEITENTSLIKFCHFRYNAFSKNDKIDIEKSNKLLEEDGNIFGVYGNNIATKEGKQEKTENGDTEINGKECNVDEAIQSETKIEETIGINSSVDIGVTRTNDEVNEKKKTKNETTKINGEESAVGVIQSETKIKETVKMSKSVNQGAVTSTHDKVNGEKLTEINNEETIQSETNIEEAVNIKNSEDMRVVTITHDEVNEEKKQTKNEHTEVNDEKKIVEGIKQSGTKTEQVVAINNSEEIPTVGVAKNSHEKHESGNDSSKNTD